MAALETGRRRLTGVELLALPQVMADLSDEEDLTLASLLVGQVIEVSPGVSVEGIEAAVGGPRPRLKAVLSGTDSAWEQALGSDLPGGILADVPESEWDAAVVSGKGEAEQKASSRLDVPAGFVGLAAYALWGRSFTAERDARVQDRASEAPSPRSRQAMRGHVTRAMTEEVREHLDEKLDRFTAEEG